MGVDSELVTGWYSRPASIDATGRRTNADDELQRTCAPLKGKRSVLAVSTTGRQFSEAVAGSGVDLVGELLFLQRQMHSRIQSHQQLN